MVLCSSKEDIAMLIYVCNMEKQKIKLIAYYLPQFYELDVNIPVFGRGYTEWTRTANAKPLFKGHYQPHVPADLGFYNLLMPEPRLAQAEMAKEYGIDGFCYWHYWFGNGVVTMEKPFKAVIESGQPDFPVCLCWANHTWRNTQTQELVVEQTYPGERDVIDHFNYVLPAFKDKRYIRIDDKPVFGIFDPAQIPYLDQMIDIWNSLAKDNGLAGIYFIGIAQTVAEYDAIKTFNLDAINTVRLKDYFNHTNKYIDYLKNVLHFPLEHIFPYGKFSKYFVSDIDESENVIPTILSGWDHTPRYGNKALVLKDYTPQAFEKHVTEVLDIVSKKKNQLCFVKAWNEWGEGNHLEPDIRWGKAFLEVIKKVKSQYLSL